MEPKNWANKTSRNTIMIEASSNPLFSNLHLRGFGGFKHVWIIPAPTWDDSRKLQKLQKLQKVQKLQKLQKLSI